MNFKNKLAMVFSKTQKIEQEELDKLIASMERTPEEWEIVKEHISNCILKNASIPHSARKYSVLKGKWIYLPSQDYIGFSDPYYSYEKFDSKKADFCKQHGIIINWRDMERFCKEEKLSLRYGLNTSFGPDQTRIVKRINARQYVSYYLVRVS